MQEGPPSRNLVSDQHVMRNMFRLKYKNATVRASKAQRSRYGDWLWAGRPRGRSLSRVMLRLIGL
jgi:hypothetical protein